MAIGTVTVTIYNRAWSSQGTFTSAYNPKGSFLRNDVGEGGFTFPMYDTPALDLVRYNRIAVVTVEESGSSSGVVCAFHIRNITPRRIRSGGYDGYVVDVSGPGILAELQWDNIGYVTISDGSQGPTTSWLSTIVGYAQETWAINGFPSGEAYLQAAGETCWDAILECASQLGCGVSYAPKFATQTAIAPYGREILFVETPIAGNVILDYWPLELVKSGATGDECDILDIKPIEDSHEVATRVTIYGAGIGADVFTIAEAQGLVTVPAGFSVDWTNSVITNTALEAVTDQPIVHQLHQLGHIKPEDNDDATAVETAAIQLFWAGIAFLRDRLADRRQFYEVTFIGKPGYDYAVMQLASLTYSETSPIDAAGASNTTNVINVNDNFVVHEMHITVPNSGQHKGMRLITVVLGEQISSDAYIRPLPSDGDVVIKKLKEHDEVLRHATASYAPSTPGGNGTYATADAPFLVLSNTTNLTNERQFVAGAGLAATDGGANGNYTVDIVAANTSLTINADNMQVRLATNSGLTVSSGVALGTPSSVGSGSSNSVTTTTHSHAVNLAATDLPPHVIATNTGLGSQHTISGATAGHVLRASGATTAAFAQLQHSDLGGVSANQHHNQSHVLATTSALGPDHTVSGLTARQVLIATGATTALFRALQSADLPTGATLSVSSTNSGNSHAITTSSAISTATAVIMATDSNGRHQLRGLGVGTAANENGAINVAGRVLINETSDANVTTGIVINQGTADDAVITLKSSEVAHGITDLAETDTFGHIGKAGDGETPLTGTDAGGLRVLGLRDADGGANRALVMAGFLGEAADTGTTLGASGSNGVVQITAAVKSGTGIGVVADSGNSFSLSNNGVTNLLVKGNGDTYQRGELQMTLDGLAHGITNAAITSAYTRLAPYTSTGGLGLAGLTEDVVGVGIGAYVTNGNTTKSTAGTGAIDLLIRKKSGVSWTAMGANENLVVVRDSGSTRWIVDKEGDTHRDGTDNAFDTYHDAHLARAFDRAVSPGAVVDSEFDVWVQYGRKELIEAGILHESGFYNESRLLRLAIGAVWQEYTERQRLQARVEQLEQRLLN